MTYAFNMGKANLFISHFTLICSGSFSCFSSPVIFSLASVHSSIAGKELSIQITFCGEALECLHSIMFKMQFVFCIGRSCVYCDCMNVFVVLACFVCTVAMPC